MKNSSNFFLLILFTCLFGWGCEKDKSADSKTDNPVKTTKSNPSTSSPMFEEVLPQQSGVNFTNVMKSGEPFNILTYEYKYNGGGVALGDINNDGLTDIFVTSNVTPDGLFLNKGNMTFQDISAPSGIQYQGYSTGAVMADVNGDGWLDIYVCRSSFYAASLRMNSLYINQGDNTFKDMAKAYGVADTSYASHANFFDYDKDGDLDLYVVNHRVDFRDANNITLERDPGTGELSIAKKADLEQVTDRLYRNNGFSPGNETFTDVTTKAGVKNRAFGLSATVADVNDDGWPDLFVANDFVDKDKLFINNRNGTFTDKLESYFGHISRNSMGADIADFNNDGLVDMFVTDMIPQTNERLKKLKGIDPYDKYQLAVKYGGYHQVMRNVLQVNRGGGRFSEMGELAGVSHTDWSWAPLFADFDNDGLKDLFITNGYRRDASDMDFADYILPEAMKKAQGGKMSNLELVNLMPVTTKLPNFLYKNNGDNSFLDISGAAGMTKSLFSNGAAYGDLDGDGDLDLVVNNLDDPISIYRNTSAETGKANHLRIRLKGEKKNTFGVGAKVTITTSKGIQYQEFTPVHGYYSSVEPILHFGLGNETSVKEVSVKWPDGKQQKLANVPANQLLVLDHKNAGSGKKSPPKSAPIFTDLTGKKGPKFTHKEDDYNDFKVNVLIPHMMSREGPFLAIADVNGDGLEDVYAGAATGSAGALFFQRKNGSFSESPQPAFQQDREMEDGEARFFDADGDGDHDLYVVSGGCAFPEGDGKYQDRLYMNDGKGNFTKNNDALPKLAASGACVVAKDFDGDGDEDVFVGGRVVVGKYPVAAQSYLLRNDKGTFTDISSSLPRGGKLGMVFDAEWADIDGDNKAELIVAGEWMPVTILQIDGEKVTATEIPNSKGWWNSITVADFDKDGDPDLVLGNEGLNSFFKATPTQPITMYAGDFDANGQIDPIMCYYNHGVSYPKNTRDELIRQISFVKKKFPRNADFANATIREILSPDQMKSSLQLTCETFATSYFQNDGGRFAIRPLPLDAQVAPINDALAADIDGDGNVDLILTGNEFNPDVEVGRYDACFGVYLKGDGKGGFTAIPATESGLVVPYDSRDLEMVKLADGKSLLLVGNNDAGMQVFGW